MISNTLIGSSIRFVELLKKVYKNNPPIKEIVDYLEANGFLVKKVKNYKNISVDRVIALFYQRLEDRFGFAYSFGCKNSSNLKDDRAAVKKFQSKVEKSGYSAKAANLLAYNIIELVFDHYDRFNFRKDLFSIKFIFDSHGSWIISRLIEMMNTEKKTLATSSEFLEILDKMDQIEDNRLVELQKQRYEEIVGKNAKEEKDPS